MSLVKQAVLTGLKVVSALYAMVHAVLLLVRARARLGTAPRILLYPEGGFGHTLSGPDWLRRRYPGEDWLVVFGYSPGRHNPMVAELWGERYFLWLPVSPDYPRVGGLVRTQWSEAIFRWFGRRIARLNPSADILTITELRRRTPLAEGIDPGDKFARTPEAKFLPLVVRQDATALRLPDGRRTEVLDALRARGMIGRRRCTLFVRAKGLGSEDVSNARRCGAPIEAHIPAIRWLTNSGFLVLLTGDYLLDESTAQDLGPAVVDWRRLGVNRHAYMLFAGTETDLLIGNMAGGSAFAHTNAVPTLILDAFPFAWCIPRTTVHYKTLRARDGQLVPFAETLTRYAVDFACEGAVLHSNTAEEITAAVMDFALSAEKGRVHGVGWSELGIDLPVLRSGDARISPAWLNIFNHGSGAC